jgi:tetratricopeptide (TPR) repeat protein
MSHIDPQVDPEVLADIRRAAFELRQSDPQEAVRLLRRAAATGGGAEVLARGALGEIYLEEFGDLDGAEHEFRTVLQAIPGLPAAEVGLARVLHQAGDRRGELQALGRAVEGLSHDVAGFRERKDAGEPLPAGVEEVVLTLLEVALDRAHLDPDQPLDEDLLRWAAEERLFDALREEEEDPQQDWVRFHSLWTQLRQVSGRPEEAARALAEAEEAGQLPARDAAALRRDALEEIGDVEAAAAQARRVVDLDSPAARGPAAMDVLRAAALTSVAGDEARASEMLRTALARAEAELPDAPPERRIGLEDAVRRYREALAPEPGSLVSLRVKK